MYIFYKFIQVFFFVIFLTLPIAKSKTKADDSSLEINKSAIKNYELLYKTFEVLDSKGIKHNFSSIKAPIVVVNFWASWCLPCIKEFPSLNRLRKNYKEEEIFILGINTDEEDALKKMNKAIAEYHLKFPNVQDARGNIAEQFKITAIPVSIIYHNGKVIELGNGEKDFTADALLKKFDTILKK